jgi:hypothetical protein
MLDLSEMDGRSLPALPGEESPGTTGPRRLLTAGQGDLTDSATENIPPAGQLAGKGEPVR